MTRTRFAHYLLLAIALTVRNLVELAFLIDGRHRAHRAAAKVQLYPRGWEFDR